MSGARFAALHFPKTNQIFFYFISFTKCYVQTIISQKKKKYEKFKTIFGDASGTGMSWIYVL